jgi:outer membrane protein assembly factor BamC
MRFDALGTRLAAIGAAALIGACSSLNLEIPSKKVEYKSAGKLPTLEVPPDLVQPSADDRYVVPNAAKGTATYSTYALDRELRPARAASGGVLPEPGDAHIERAGSQRWLVVKGDPAQVWPTVKDFWLGMGLLINVEQPEAGVMETDWAENRARVPDGFLRNTLGKLLDSFYSTAERDKFRTRLERGAQPGTTEIYVSHRGMEEVYITEGRDQTRWQPRKPDPGLEAEMLQRLLVRFGVKQERAKQQMAVAAQAPRATMASKDGGILTVNDQFDRAWRRVGLALDRVGFTVEDRDRSKGIYFVRYIDPDVDVTKGRDENTGLFARTLNSLKFWGKSSDKKNEQYQIAVRDMKDTSQVNVLTKDGRQDLSPTAGRILNLLYDQLK